MKHDRTSQQANTGAEGEQSMLGEQADGGVQAAELSVALLRGQYGPVQRKSKPGSNGGRRPHLSQSLIRRAFGTSSAGNVQRSESADLSESSSEAEAELDTAQVQLSAASGEPRGMQAVQAVATQGLGGTATNLPHLERIQRSFGGHDISSVKAHVGGPAAAASDVMGAAAYAMGDAVAFRDSPDVRTAAHEATHIVQQRAGVELDGGVGRTGDRYEQQADLAADAVVRGESAVGLLPAADLKTEGGSAVQRFDAIDEHKRVGDIGSGGREYVWTSEKGEEQTARSAEPMPTASTPREDRAGFPIMCEPHRFEFRLTHGDISMLSGDYFDPREDESSSKAQESGKQEGDKSKPSDKPKPIDSLFDLARTPSSAPGTEVGTQDEIIYAIYKLKPGDPRFTAKCSQEQPSGGVWALHPGRFSSDVKKSVDKRYYRLAAKNRDHFVAPAGGTRRGGPRSSAGGAYRAVHEQAILSAFDAGHTGRDVGAAMALEAGAQHFLIDGFAAGHIRTPRASMVDYWGGKHPDFWQNLLDRIVSDVAHHLYMQAAQDPYGVHPPERYLRRETRSAIRSELSSFPEIGLGEMLSKIVHDVDNEEGLWVVNDAEMRWKAFGDSRMHDPDPQNRTPEVAVEAVSLGNGDVEFAEILGVIDAGHAPRPEEEVLQQVRERAVTYSKPAVKYAPERMLPRPDEKQQNGTITWRVESFEALWNTIVRSDLNPPSTYGMHILQSLKPNGTFHSQLHDVGVKLDESKAGLNPRAAFLEGFLAPLSANPYSVLLTLL